MSYPAEKLCRGLEQRARFQMAVSYTHLNDAQGTWKRDEKGWWFEFKDGTYPSGEKTSDQNGEKLGWIQKDGKWWAVGSDGYLKRGWAQDNANGKWYLIDENTGMQTSWHYDESDQHWYYLDPASGAMLTGWQLSLIHILISTSYAEI